MTEQLLQKLIDEVRLLRADLRELNQYKEETSIEIAPTFKFAEVTIDEKIANLLLKFRVATHVKGYEMLCKAIELVYFDPTLLSRMTKELYPVLSKEFETTPSRVERAMRHAIEISWANLNSEAMYKSLGIDNKPTNSQFISLLASVIKRGSYGDLKTNEGSDAFDRLVVS